MLLGGNTGIGPWDVDQADQRERVTLGQLHQPHRLAIPLRVRHAEVPRRAFLEVASLLVSDQGDGPTLEAAEPDDDGRIVGASAVSVQLDPVLEQALHVVQRVRTILVPGELYGPPDLLVRRRCLDALELTLQLLELARKARTAEQVETTQARQALAQPQLLVTRHSW